jgi:hypothetical protein
MDWRQFLCDEIDRKIALIRLVMPGNASLVANDQDNTSDISAYDIQERREHVAVIDAAGY